MKNNLFKTAALAAVISLLVGCEPPDKPQRESARDAGQPPLASQPGPKPEDPTPSAPSQTVFPEEGEPSTARNFYFVIDGSGSMSGRAPAKGDGRSFDTKLEGAKWAVKQFLQHVPTNTNLGLYVFDGKGKREVLALGPNNRDAFLQQVLAMRTGGGTPLGESVRVAVDRLLQQYKMQLGYGEYRLVVVTDGEAGDDIDGAVQYAASHTIPIYTIGFYLKQEHSLRKHSVSYQGANDATQLAQGLKATLAETEVFHVDTFNE